MASKDHQVAALRKQRETIQTKTFIKWMNSHLKDLGLQVEVLDDLQDGICIHATLQKLADEQFKLPSKKPRMRIQQIENVNACLTFMKSKEIKLEAIGGQDIVDGNVTLTLGLLWTMVLCFQLEEVEGEDAKNAKEALLRWCQRKTKGYPGVKVENFTTSWRDGLAFNALIHKHRPDLINFDALDPKDPITNLNNAFDIAERELGITSLLDAEDVLDFPDDKSIMTYLIAYYQKFAKMEQDDVWKRRLNNVLNFQLQMEHDENTFELETGDLLQWVQDKIAWLQRRDFPNSLEGVQEAMHDFKEYRVKEKPPRFVAKGNLEAALFTIQMKLRSGNRVRYQVPQGRDVAAINSHWDRLEKEEHEREIAMREELRRQEKLLEISKTFHRKADRREDWVSETLDRVTDESFGSSLAEVTASQKKEDMMNTEIDAYEKRLQALDELHQQLQDGSFNDVEAVSGRVEDLREEWEDLLQQMRERGVKLSELHDLFRVYAEIEDAVLFIERTSNAIVTAPAGKDVDEVAELQEKHTHVQTDIDAMAKATGAQLAAAVTQFTKSNHSKVDLIVQKQTEITSAFETLRQQAAERDALLKRSMLVCAFMQDVQEERSWIINTMPTAASKDVGSSLTAVHKNIKRHQMLLDEISGRDRASYSKVMETGRALAQQKDAYEPQILTALRALEELWKELQYGAQQREIGLKVALRAQEYLVAANDADSRMSEFEPQVTSTDYGHDEHTSQALLDRFNAVQEDITTFSKVMQHLAQLSQEIAGMPKPDKVSAAPTPAVSAQGSQQRLTAPKPTAERVVATQDYTAQRGKELSFTKGTVFTVKAKRDSGLWKVEDAHGSIGMIPSALVVAAPQEDEDAASQPKPRASPPRPALSRAQSIAADLAFPNHVVGVTTRQAALDARYHDLQQRAQQRALALRDSTSFHSLQRDIGVLVDWLEEKRPIYESVDIGHNGEQLGLIKRKFDAFMQELLGKESALAAINSRAEELLAAAHTQSDKIVAEQDHVNALWKEVDAKAATRQQQLEEAHETFEFRERVEELQEWIREKLAIMPEDLGRDVSSVHALQRQHEAFKSEIQPIDGEVGDLMAKNAAADVQRSELLQLLQQHLEGLNAKAQERQARIAAALDLQVFLRDYQTADAWLAGLSADIAGSELHSDLTSAEVALEQHDGLKAEMDARFPWYTQVADRGTALVQEGHFAADDIGDKSNALRTTMAEAAKAWEEKRHQLQQCFDLRRFEAATARAGATLDRLESDLATTAVGDSLDEVQVLQKTHAGVQQRIAASTDEVPGVVAACEAMLADNHYESAAIKSKSDELVARRRAVEERASERALRLQHSATLQAFLRDAGEVESWLADKEKMVAERNYEDKLNLKGKLQRHKLLVLEMGTNEDVLCDLEKRAGAAAEDRNYAAGDMRERADALRTRFEAFRAACEEKTARIEEAIAEQDFARSAADFDLWFEQVQAQLAETDVGGDRIAAAQLLKKHQQLMADVAAKQQVVDLISSSAEALIAAGNYESESIAQTRKHVGERYASLEEPCSVRLKALEDSLAWQTYLSSFRSEKAWIDERWERAHASNVGDNPADAQSLLKKHQAFHAEVLPHEDLITAAVEAGDALVPDNAHSEKIYEHNEELTKAFQDLVDASSDRLRVLMENNSAQHYFAQCTDALEWCRAHEAAAGSTEYGEGEESATAGLLAKHDALSSDLSAHRVLTQELVDQGRGLMEAGNFDQERIAAQMAAVQEAIDRLTADASKRKTALEQRMLFHQFVQDCNDSLAWLDKSLETARCTDIGEDQDHCEVLRERFDDFAQSVRANEHDMVHKPVALSEERSAHVDGPRMLDLAQQLSMRLKELQAAMASRETQLNNATEVHTFVRETSELLARVEEKHGPARSQEYGSDLPAAESLKRLHDRFELSVQALRGAVRQQAEKADALAPRHPASSGRILDMKQRLQDAWQQLLDATAARKTALEASNLLHQFLTQQRYMVSWIGDMAAQVNAHERPTSVDGAEKALELHATYKSEIDTRRVGFDDLVSFGQRLLETQPQHVEAVSSGLDALRTAFASLTQQWEEVRRALHLAKDALVFEHETQALEAWLQTQESLLLGDDALEAAVDAGGDVDVDVDALLDKHGELEALLDAHTGKLHSLRRLTKFEEESLQQDAIHQHYQRFEQEDRAEQERRAERQRQEQAEQLQQQQLLEAEMQRQHELEEAMRQEREKQAAQAAQEDTARAKATAEAIVQQEKRRATQLAEELVTAAASARAKLAEKRAAEEQLRSREQKVVEAERRASLSGTRVMRTQRASDFLPRMPLPSDGGNTTTTASTPSTTRATSTSSTLARDADAPAPGATLASEPAGSNARAPLNGAPSINGGHAHASAGAESREEDDEGEDEDIQAVLSYPSQLNPGSQRYVMAADGKMSSSSLNTEYSALSSRSELPPHMLDSQAARAEHGLSTLSISSSPSVPRRANTSSAADSLVPDDDPPPLPEDEVPDIPLDEDEEV
ncbi:alpha-actinin 4 [Salpingoeca rosetta]|uniref:Alpha-actinin 4 n=1 Tax=Salpingoeca rosetta (strain ATCC 50818 / BSB-021) TaxID=946362 RepID=F2U4B5_SALR5|nr:alpha-actinin 4 [Salpingoeca rosetta]EGD82481.1 alpha-actinin 4 [Salpingoeca rosetta]|eukprot:XP_004995717.1 alpha-actinin 4 [Salpingoeca rosetta]